MNSTCNIAWGRAHNHVADQSMGRSAGKRRATPPKAKEPPVDFTAQFNACYRVLWLVAVGIVGDATAAEDVVQEAALLALGKIEQFKPARVAIDSFSALERVSTPRSFREFVIDLTSFIKEREIAGLFTAATPSLLGGESVTESHISTITDSIILLRYVELYGEMRRGITVLKMRGSPHHKEIREFSIDSVGMHIGNAFRNVTGILSGNPRQAAPGELDRMAQLFEAES